jgi:hypothetical protein
LTLKHWGLEVPAKQAAPSFGAVLAYILATTTVLARPPTELDLTTFGAFLQIAARIIGPAFFGLAILALRARVKR